MKQRDQEIYKNINIYAIQLRKQIGRSNDDKKIVNIDWLMKNVND